NAHRLGCRSRMGTAWICIVSLSAESFVSTARQSQPPVVEFKKVSVRFGSFTALHDVSFAINNIPDRGEFISMIGPSRCGKSTILILIAGFLKPTSGEVLVGGQPVSGPGRDRGMIFQQYSSFPHLTVIQNVLFGLEINKHEINLDYAGRLKRAGELIEQVGLA